MAHTLGEVEKIIEGWPHPWPELLSLYKQFRDDKLDHALDDAERTRATDEYEGRVMRMVHERHDS